LSRPIGGVTSKRACGFGLVTGFIGHFRFIITIHRLALLLILTVYTRTESSQSAVPSSVLWYQLSTTDSPLPGFQTVLAPQSQKLLTHSAPAETALELPPLLTSYVLQ
jgi:hypothetical protein